MLQLMCVGLFLPLIGFFILLISSRTITRGLAYLVGCTSIFLSFLCFFSLLWHTNANTSENVTLYQWIAFPRLSSDVTLHLDSLSLLMTLIITGVGFLIHFYSMGYMDHETDYARFYACMNFFVFCMLLLVLAANLLLLFIGWEGVGLASYLLIGFWYTRPSAAQAATKAFVVNRVGDLGLLLGLILTFHTFGSSDIETVIAHSKEVAVPVLTVLTLLYFIGAIGKSAQLPLHVWLPDAMEGPTPVSALIHAATMVTAGVYLVVRMHPLFMQAPQTLYLVGVVGAVTSLFAALCAVGQKDLKRVLAYSTVSQLGLMFLACGAGAFYAAMFHLTTHAFMKALLFLSAGNVVHMMHGITDMGQMGGLRKPFYITHWLFLVGVIAMSGIPPLAAFFSKDLILEVEYIEGYTTLYYVALAASILTAFYLMRAYCLTFMGKQHHSTLTEDVKEAPRIMLGPVSILAVLSILGGCLGFACFKLPLLEEFLTGLEITPVEEKLSFHLDWGPAMVLSIVGAFAGLGSAILLFIYKREQLRNSLQILRKSFYIDEIYDFAFVKPLKKIANFFAGVLEPKFFELSMSRVAHSMQFFARHLQYIQSGQIRSYVAWMVLGGIMFALYMYLEL